MSLARRLWWLGLTVVALLAPLPLVHAQTGSSRTIATATGPDSFWVKQSATGSSAGRAPGAGKNRGRTHALGADSNAANSSGNKVNNSIASELSGSKSVPWSIVVGLTLLTLLPALLLSMTPLVRLLVVFHFLRQALGTQTAPSNQVLMGLALMMTWFLMQPVLLQVEQQAVTPYQAGTISGVDAMDRGIQPVKQYMLRYAREKDLAVFAAAGMSARPSTKQELHIQ